MPRTQKVLIILFSSIFGLNILFGIAPLNEKNEGVISKKIDPIRWTVGAAQKWDMFHSIPTLSGLEIELIAENIKGEKFNLGPGIPGLKKIEPKEKIRFHYTFLRLFQNPSNNTFKEAYIISLQKALHKSDPSLINFSIVLYLNVINKIGDIKLGSNISRPIVQTFGPYPLSKKE